LNCSEQHWIKGKENVMTKRILAVDDSPSIRKMVGFTLRSAGYEVVEAEDGQDGLEKAQAQVEEISLVLTDQNMPRMDGLTLVKSLRALPAYRTAPILMLTTESSDEMKAQGRAAGATGWMVKPFDPTRLLAVVKKVLG
jgi:two-component system chemotaxis response regulator CheY